MLCLSGVGVLSGQLYATGGHDGPLVRKSVEVYDPGTNTWKQVADMNMCRRNAGNAAALCLPRGCGSFLRKHWLSGSQAGAELSHEQDVHLLVGSGLLEGELGTPKASHRVPTEVQRVPSSQ